MRLLLAAIGIRGPPREVRLWKRLGCGDMSIKSVRHRSPHKAEARRNVGGVLGKDCSIDSVMKRGD